MEAEPNRFLRLFLPDHTAESVSSVDTAQLHGLGIEALLMDLDNTLVPWHGYEISDDTLRWLRDAEALGLKICIVSNTRYPGRLKRLAGQMQVPFVKGTLKPRKSAFRPALKLLGVAPDRAAVIGDQIFTDILGGNRLGLYTILVKPLSRREFFGTKISRLFERIILRALGPSPGNRGSREQSPGGSSQRKSEQ